MFKKNEILIFFRVWKSNPGIDVQYTHTHTCTEICSDDDHYLKESELFKRILRAYLAYILVNI